MYQIKCIICEKDFESKIPHKKTCSSECRKRLGAKHSYKNYLNKKENGVLKICEICKKEFHTEREDARFCSMGCANIGKNKPNKKETIIEYCLNCGKEIENKIGGSKNKKFCCIGCSNSYNKKHDDVVKKCENCGKEFVVIYIDRKNRFCSKNCSTKFFMDNMNEKQKEKWKEKISNAQKEQFKLGIREINSGEKNGFFGKHHSLENRKQFSENNKGTNNPMYGKNHTQETIEQISKIRCEKIINGEYVTWFDKGKIFSNKMNKEISYRSSWEKNVLEFLDKNEEVISFDHEPFYIEYLFEEHKKHYIPDILIEYKDGIKKLIEIKPECFVNESINQAKFQAAQKYCDEKGITFEIWTESNIQTLLDNS